MTKLVCPVCFHHCQLDEGQTGFCMAYQNQGGKLTSLTYGKLTALALDPIEKKPLAQFMPGSLVLSVGTFGCNLKCPFCQNSEISTAHMGQDGEGVAFTDRYGEDQAIPIRTCPPEDLVEMAKKYRTVGNIGLAFTYNEPLINYEYVRDAARLSKEAGMKNVLVTNGSVTLPIFRQVLPYIDAINVDLKSFDPNYYRDVLRGDLDTVKDFIEEAVGKTHLEVTTLVLPDDKEKNEEMVREMTDYLSSLNGGRGAKIPYHISRFFPAFKMSKWMATDRDEIFDLVDIAREKMDYVYPGNV